MKIVSATSGAPVEQLQPNELTSVSLFVKEPGAILTNKKDETNERHKEELN